MQTALQKERLTPSTARVAEAILRSCVHCGFCNATCPTYLLTGEELDGPRGRIYLVKNFLEGQDNAILTRHHLDRCLTCRACETTCPSGVRYARLADIARDQLHTRARRSLPVRLGRRLLEATLRTPRGLNVLLTLARPVRRALPRGLRRRLNVPAPGTVPDARHARRVLLLDGCVQPALAPRINAAATRVLDRLGISAVCPPGAGCCGAMAFHLGDIETARRHARRNLDAWQDQMNAGAEALVVTASGCAVMLREYGSLLEEDATYGPRAAALAKRVRDIGELVAAAQTHKLRAATRPGRIAWHAPCTLRHGLRADRGVEDLLRGAGHELLPVADAHLCCGSAGTYSLLQPRLSRPLLDNKIHALCANGPELIVTANIGCLLQLQSATDVPVRHWIELLDDAG